MSDITRVYTPLIRQIDTINMDVMTLHLWLHEVRDGESHHGMTDIRDLLSQVEREVSRFLVTGRRSRLAHDHDLIGPVAHMQVPLQRLHRLLFREGVSIPGDVADHARLLDGTLRSVVRDVVQENGNLKRSMSIYISRVTFTQIALIVASLVIGAAVLIMALRLGRRRRADYQAVVDSDRQLRENQLHLAEAQRIARLGNWEWDIVHDRITCSDEVYRLFGIEPSDFDGSLAAFYRLVYSEDREHVRRVLESAIRQREPYICDYRITRPDGEERVMHAMAETHFDERGQALRMFGTIQDVTEQRRSDERVQRLASAVEQADECVLIVDQNGLIEYANPAFERISGYTAAEVVGKSPNIVKSGEHPDAYYRTMWDTLMAGKRWVGSFINCCKDGSLYEVEQSISPILDDNGRITGFSSVQRDVTEQKRQRSQLEHTQRLEALGVLAGGIAHDFNNILTAIIGNAAMAGRKLERQSTATEYLARIELAAQRAADLCKQMLAYSGKGRFSPGPLNLSVLVEEMASLLEISIAKNVTLRLHLTESLPAIEADVAQMQQVVMNLVINAAESIIGDGGGTVTVSTGTKDVNRAYLVGSYLDDNLPAGRYVYLEVADTGCGMDEETRTKIFDPFFTTKFTGRGLGMSAVLGIVRGHHGTIRVYSEPEMGSSFRVLLPCSEVEIPTPAEIQGDIDAWRGGGVVLVVDDEDTIRETAAMILESVGFDVLWAADGEEGVATFREHADEIVAVLLDMTMPRMNGNIALSEIRQIRSDVPVVISSGYSETEINSHFAERRVSGFIQKPYTPDDLKRKMHEVLSG
ncbi:MAG TPA: PAS domain S-box protein [Mariprofundaceae bacterium]|nr:PAS domain S-box protein [Mariprofundaceae bacterium]